MSTMNQKRVVQQGAVEYVRLGSMAVPADAQREFKQRWSDKILAEFDLDRFGLPVVSERRGTYYILDGQHRVDAMRRWLGDGWEDQRIECRVFHDLTEREEADFFDRLNDVLPVTTYERFRIRVNAGREAETRIKKVVEAQGLNISKGRAKSGAVCAVGTLRKVYVRAGEDVLGRSLRIIRDAFGDAGFESPVIDGVAHLCQRYDGVLDEREAILRLGKVHGGVKGLLNMAAKLNENFGGTRSHAVAGACVDVINQKRKRGQQRLPSWWSTGK